MSAVYLVDASPYIFRAHFSLPSSLVDPAGRPVGATYGFATFLLKLIDQETPTHLAVAFDRSLTTSFRNEIYPAYKGGRQPPPPELVAQLDDCLEMAEALGAAVFVDDSYEADDLIGTLVTRIAAAKQAAVIVSSDKDLAQLVSSRVTLFDFARNSRLGVAEVRAKFGVDPGQIVDLLALAGDSVDNIPGVSGVGQKTAVRLLCELGDLEALYRRLDEVEKLPIRGAVSVRAKLEKSQEEALLSQRLATIARDAPVHAELEDLRFVGADRQRVDDVFARLGFNSIRERIHRWR